VDCLNHGFTVDVDADARKVAASAYCVGFALKQCFAFHTVMDHMGYYMGYSNTVFLCTISYARHTWLSHVGLTPLYNTMEKLDKPQVYAII